MLLEKGGALLVRGAERSHLEYDVIGLMVLDGPQCLVQM